MDRVYALYPRYDEKGLEIIKSAYSIASVALKDMTRSNGHPFIEHPDAVAKIAYEEIGLPAECIAAIYLHEASRFFPETDITSGKFGKDVYTIVDGLNKISTINPKDTRLEAENYKKLIVSYSRDPRVTVLKIAAVKTHINKPFERKILTYQGFDVVVPARMQPKMPNAKDEKAALFKEPIPYVYVKRCGSYYMEIESNAGITKRLNNLLENLDFRRENMEKELDRLKFQKEMLEKELSTESSSYLEEIEELTKEIQKIDEELGLKTA